MKSSTAALLSVALAISLTACDRGKDRASDGSSAAAPAYEELGTGVPDTFADSHKWNQAKICPAGATLTPFTRYDAEPGPSAHGFKSYFGRSCAIIEGWQPEETGRKLASVEAKPAGAPITVIPHGPFVWWYENGRRMETGSFDHGTLSADSVRYEPDGSAAPQQD